MNSIAAYWVLRAPLYQAPRGFHAPLPSVAQGPESHLILLSLARTSGFPAARPLIAETAPAVPSASAGTLFAPARLCGWGKNP